MDCYFYLGCRYFPRTLVSAVDDIVVQSTVADNVAALYILSSFTVQTINIRNNFKLKKLKLCDQEGYKHLLVSVGRIIHKLYN